MKNLSKEMLINELAVKKREWLIIQKEIVDKRITNYAHKLYEERNKIVGEMNILQKLINTIK